MNPGKFTRQSAICRFITGSAASSTALCSGQKTNIGVIGMVPDGKAVKTLAEMAREQGKKVGIVSRVSIDHATPAAASKIPRGNGKGRNPKATPWKRPKRTATKS